MNKTTMRSSFFVWLMLAATAALAHHSAPVFYKVQERVTVSGTVTELAEAPASNA